MLKDKNIIVTGGSRGIGRAICLEIARRGANVAVVYAGNDAAAAETVEEVKKLGVKAVSYKLDVSDFEACKNTVAQIAKDFPSVDGLVNNAGVTADTLLLRMTEQDYDKVLNVNLKGTFNMIKHVSPIMIRARKGHIVNMSSVVGLSGNAGQINYSASKAGVVGVTKSAAKELAPRGITCNAIAPGFIGTDMTAKLTDAQKDAILQSVPLKRMGGAEEVAALAAFLLSDAAAYITGEVIKIDGGLYI